MSKEFKEPEEKTNIPIPDDDMLTSEVPIDRSHARAGTSGPEVNEFIPPPFQGEPEIDQPQEPKDPADNPFANPGVKDVPPAAKKKGAEFLADKILKGWGKGKASLAEWLIMISERKMDRLEADGIIDRNIILPLRNGTTTTAGRIVTSHNNDVQKVIDEFALTQEFYDEAFPMVVEELAKRDVALTNLQMLAATAAMDLYSFGEELKPLYHQGSDIMNAFKRATTAYQQAPSGFKPNYGPQPQTQPNPQPQPQQQAAETDHDEHEFNPSEPVETVVTENYQPEPAIVVPLHRDEVVNSAFDDLQGGDQNIITPTFGAQLPSEFSGQPISTSNKKNKKKSRVGDNIQSRTVKKKRGPYKKKAKTF